MHLKIKIAYMRTVYLLCTVYRKYVRKTIAKFYGQNFFSWQFSSYSSDICTLQGKQPITVCTA